MKQIHKYGGILIWVLISTVVILWSINYIAEQKIKSFLDRKVVEGQFQYETFNYSILTNKGNIHSPVLLLKNKSNAKIIKASRFSIAGFSVYKYLVHGDININKIDIINPELIISPNLSGIAPSDSNSENQNISHNILIDQLNVKDGTIQYFKNDSSQQTLFCNISQIKIESLQLNTADLIQSPSILYKNLSITGDSLFYRMSQLYELKVANFNSENDQIEIDSLQIMPRYDKKGFEAIIPYEKTQVNLKIPRVILDRYKLNHQNDTLSIAASMLRLDTATLYLYRNKILPDSKNLNPLYSKIFRELPFRLDIDTISVVDAAITYELKVKSDRSPGLVFVDALNGSVMNLTNVGMYKDEFPTTRISVDALLMKESPIHLDWTFDIDNRLDEFKVSGIMSRITQKGINYFVAPILNASVEGAIDHLAFNFAGNNVEAKGDSYIQYDTLRINVLRSEGYEKKPILSALVNLLIKNKLNGSIEKKGIVVKRDQTKSFWTYLWEMVKDGTLKSIT